MSIIIGLDPGSLNTGYGVIEIGKKIQCLEYGVIRNSSKSSFSDRLLKIGVELREVFKKYPSAEVVVERIFLGRNIDSAFKLGHVRGLAIFQAGDLGLKVVEYAAREVKKGITGYGGAEKEQVRFLVANYLGVKEEIPMDASDALALAIYRSQRQSTDEKIQRALEASF